MVDIDANPPKGRQTRSRTGTTRTLTAKATHAPATMVGATRKTKSASKPASKSASKPAASKSGKNKNREDSLSRQFPSLLPALLGPPLSSSSPSPPLATELPVEPAVVQLIRSSPLPPRASSPVPGPAHDLEIEYTLRVNKESKVKDIAVVPRHEFVVWEMEDIVETMIRSPASGVDGREYRVSVIGVTFRAGRRAKTSRTAFKQKTFTDFAESGDALLRYIDRAADQLKGRDLIEMRVDVRVEVVLLQKAFPRVYANEPSSPR
ncbi:hypothetical protein PSPO01_16005 [Paraphaeosphaeria sporulosa]